MILEVDYPTITSTGSQLISGTDIQLPQYLKYVFDFGMFAGFFAVFVSFIIAGGMYIFSPVSPEAKAAAKDRFSGAIAGLLILLVLYLIVTTINPQLAIFRLTPLPEIPPPPPLPPPAGLYLYNQSDCSGDSLYLSSSSPNLGNLSNRTNAAIIIHHPSENLYYVAMLYSSPDYRGRCQWINPQISGCQTVPSFATSVSVHKYDFNPNGDGVYFYYKSFFNISCNKNDPDSSCGYLKINNDLIRHSGIYIERLNNLQFTGTGRDCTVSEDEMICNHWDNQGKCTHKICPDLAGENISSIEIRGNYVVYLVYFNPFAGDQQLGPWTFCQEFSTSADAARDGPEQIKWESIRNNSSGRLPNWLFIVPVIEK